MEFMARRLFLKNMVVCFKMTWTKKQIAQHKKAAEILEKIKDSVLEKIKNNSSVNEKEVQDFILEKFNEFGIINEVDKPIIAFAKNTSFVHYFSNENSKVLSEGDLILIDIFGRLNEDGAPYADITWMAYKGENMPKKFADFFDCIKSARDGAIQFIQEKLKTKILPSGKEIHSFVCKFFEDKNVLENFKHGTGHSLGFNNPHGEKSHINLEEESPLLKNLGYTIEPGLYFEGDFGIRSEIDFFIDDNFNFILTTPLQKKITFI
jgi:Xaa-Pro dipeptidase